MTAVTAPERRYRNYLNINYDIRSWLFSTDHKRVAILYLLSITFFFFIGGAAATLIRTELLTPKGNVVSPETYNKLFTMHGIIMVWFFLIPSIPVTLGNFLVPLMIGARDLAFPKLNLASWYVYILGGVFTIITLITGGVDTGWTFYTPYSTMFANTQRVDHRGGRLYRRLLVDLHRAELHRHHPQDACAGPDLVSPAALYLVHVCDEPGHGACHARLGDHARAWWGWNVSSAWASSTRRWAATRSCSSTSSGSIRTPRSIS